MEAVGRCQTPKAELLSLCQKLPPMSSALSSTILPLAALAVGAYFMVGSFVQKSPRRKPPTSPASSDDEETSLLDLSPTSGLLLSPINVPTRIDSSADSIECEAMPPSPALLSSPPALLSPPAFKSTPSSRMAAAELTAALRSLTPPEGRVAERAAAEAAHAIRAEAEMLAIEKATIQKVAAEKAAAESQAATEKSAASAKATDATAVIEGAKHDVARPISKKAGSRAKHSNAKHIAPSRMTTVQLRKALHEAKITFSIAEAKSSLASKLQAFHATQDAERAVEVRVADKISAHKAAAAGKPPATELAANKENSKPALKRQGSSVHDGRLKLAFASVDTDHTGSLSKRQLYEALARVGLTFSPSEQLTIWTTFDRDGNGCVEFEEFRALGAALLEQDPQLVKSMTQQRRGSGLMMSPSKGTFATRTRYDEHRLNQAAARIQALARTRSHERLRR